MLNPNNFHYLWNGRKNEDYKSDGTHYIFHPASSLVMSAIRCSSKEEQEHYLERIKKVHMHIDDEAVIGVATAHKFSNYVIVTLMVPNPSVSWPENWEHIAKEAAKWHAANWQPRPIKGLSLIPY